MRTPDEDELPPGLKAIWRSLQLGFRAEPMLLVVSAALSIGSAVPDALFALWLKLLAEGVTESSRTRVLVAALGLGGSAVAGWFLRVVGDRVQRRFRDRATVVLEAHVAELQASVATIEHHERPDYLDRLAVLRDQVFTLNHLYMSLFSVGGWVLRLGITVGLLASIHPVLALLAVFALPTVWVSSRRAVAERAAQEKAAPHNRLARHLFVLATTAPPGKEVRVAGTGERLVGDRRAAWARGYAPMAAARRGTAVLQSLAWALFGAAFVAAIVFVVEVQEARVGEVLLALAAGSRLSQYLGATVGEIGFLRGIWLDASRRLLWLEQYAQRLRHDADEPVPDRLTDGIRLENVTFRYPGTERDVLKDVDLHLPAGSVVAIVGENGAGKTTLVKLLCRFYAPTSGRVLLDDRDLATMRVDEWRSRLAGAFQDFFRFELVARQTVGLGDLDRVDDVPAVEEAITRAGAGDVVTRLARGLDTQLGPTWRDGVEMSFGQWQKLALARGFMRDRPLLLVLDEPTAALDAETEHALFERFASAARTPDGAESGRVTVLVSHRFSTVRMADLIVVLDGSVVAEAGTHEELMALGGQYASLYNIQAAAYR